jgi:hypothetical protein
MLDGPDFANARITALYAPAVGMIWRSTVISVHRSNARSGSEERPDDIGDAQARIMRV